MNYWLLTTEYPPLHGGGISTYCNFTAQMLTEAGYAVTVFTQDDSIANYIVTHEPHNVRLVRFNSNRHKLHTCLGYTARLSYAFASMVKSMIEKEGKPDIIEAQDYLGIAYYLTQFKHTGHSFLSNVPIVLTLHSPAFIYLTYNRVPTFSFPDFWTCEMEKQSIAAADLLISPTRFLVEEIEKHISLSKKGIAVIANPYKANGSTSAGFVRNKIVYYGKLSRQKGSFELLQYFKDMWDNGFKHPLHMIGGTDIAYYPEMKTMGQLVAQQYAPYIQKKLLQLHGKIAPSQINHYLQDAHVIIVPSIVDNMPYVVMEAMSIGKIVLASIQGGQREMIEDDRSGFLFDHLEPSSFSAQLTKILSLSGAAMQAIGANAVNKIRESYSFKTIIAQKLKLLQLVKENAGSKNHFPFLYQEEMMPLPDKKYIPDLLSIVIPYFNMGDYIEECIGSIQQSSYKKFELLIINDGSTDAASIDKLNALAKYDNVTIIDRPNRGVADTRNYGASIATGEFLAFLDADDKVAPSYYEKTIWALKQNDNVFFAGSWVKYFGNSSDTWPAFTPQPPYALVHNAVNSSGLVYKRNAFLAGGLNDKKVGYGMEDFESVVHMLHHGLNGVVIPEVLFYYRVRTGSMFRQVTKEKLLYSNKYISEKHEVLYKKFAIQIINLLNSNGPGYLFDNPTFKTNVSSKSGGENVLLFKFKNLIKKNERLKKMALALIKNN